LAEHSPELLPSERITHSTCLPGRRRPEDSSHRVDVTFRVSRNPCLAPYRFDAPAMGLALCSRTPVNRGTRAGRLTFAVFGSGPWSDVFTSLVILSWPSLAFRV